jgi:NAD(P)H-binding
VLSFPLGSVLAELVKTHPELKFTALVRNPSHVEAVRKLGVEVVQGNFSDTDLISSHARAADITINSGDSDSVVLNEAILTGQRARVVDDGKPPAVLLHTSGVAVFMDGGKEGKHDPSNSKIWNVRLYIAMMSCVFGESTPVSGFIGRQ